MDDGQGGDLKEQSPATQNTMETKKLIRNLVKGRLYRFAYRVKNVNGWSPMSDFTSIRTSVQPSQPDAPTLISATGTSITLQFYKPKDNGGSEVYQYKLFRNNGNASTNPEIEVTSYTSNLLTHTLTLADGLTTGLVYKFKFRAYNSVGASVDSNISVFALVDAPNAPDAPTVILSHTSDN